MIKLLNVNLTFDEGQNYVLKNVTMDIFDNEILAVVGESGGGKSSLLKIITGLVPPTSGTIIIDGVNAKNIKPTKLCRSFGYVFQEVSLFPHMTVAENISITLRLKNKSKVDQLDKAVELLKLMNLDPDKYLNRYPEELSGGEQQRIGIARALAVDSKYLFMDEPFSAVDPIMRAELYYQLLHLKQKLMKTIILVTHNVHEALRLADRIAVFFDGGLEQFDEANKVLTCPASQHVKDMFSVYDPVTKVTGK